MRFEAVKGRWSAPIAAAALLAASACSPQCGDTATATPSVTPVAQASPAASSTPAVPLMVAPAAFHAGEIGAPYAAVPLSASGGVPPYAWSVASGALPDGLTLGADGSVSGGPTSAGSFTFAIQVTDASGATASAPGAIRIAGALSAGLLPACARACQVEAGCAEVCGGFGSLNGGTPPFTYSVNGYVPPGTRLGAGLAYSGTFSRPVSYWQSTVTVTDSFGETASVSPIFNVFPHVALASGACSGGYPTGCSVQLPIGGGSGPFTVTLVSVAQNPTQGCWDPAATAPPAGYTLTVSGSSVVVSIPARILNGYAAVWTLQVTDRSLCGPNTSCVSGPATVRIGVQCG